MMEENVRVLLEELEKWGRENDAVQVEHSQKMLNLERDTAQLLSILVRSARHKHLLEVGTSNGYSTLWLAWSAEQTDGHLVSIERSSTKCALAQANLERAGLQSRVTLLVGDAAQVLEELNGPFDFVFLDANRPQYPDYLPRLLPKLSPHSLLLADNVHSHPTEIAPYLQAINKRPDLEHVVLSIGKGLSIAMKS